jgi:hypothetical protein
MELELWQKIIDTYPEIKPSDNFQALGIFLRDDSDGSGAYIETWKYAKPIPDGLKLGK